MVDKAREAAEFIVSHCPTVGAFHGTGDPYGFLVETAKEMRSAKPTSIFRDRYLEHVSYAVEMVGSNWFTSPPAAIASVYLATRFESYFRVLSGKLNGDGTWISDSARSEALTMIKDARLSRRRISSVSLAYRVMKLGSSKAVPYCEFLDRTLHAAPIETGDGFTIAHIGDRIEFGRHSVGHGQRGDISADAVFYGLMTAIFFYAQ